MSETVYRRYSVQHGEAIVTLPKGYSSTSIRDLIEYLELDMKIGERIEAKIKAEKDS